MSEKLFRRLLVLFTVIGCISTITLAVYTIVLYRDCSIISYIANGR